MKTIKEKKGFTLIELLAVIVVLAIVMVLAATTVLPLVGKARKNSLALEANSLREAASDTLTLINLGEISAPAMGDDYKETTTTNNGITTSTYCFSAKKLAEIGRWDKDIEDLTGDDATYSGKVIITTTSASSTYTYSVYLTNGQLYVNGVTGNADDDDVVESTSVPTGFSAVCS